MGVAQSGTESFTVTFKDYDGSVLKTEQVQNGGSATPPSNPSRSGYTFAGWDGSYTNVSANVTVTATYIKDTVQTYTVTFADYDGTTLKTQVVESGSSATPPADPERNGYTFTGWDRSYSNVTSNITVTATYSQNVTVTPVMTVSSVVAQPGGTVDVTITFTNNPGVNSATLAVEYGDGISLQGVTWGSSGSGTDNAYDHGTMLVWFKSDGDVTGDYTFATLTFAVDSNAPDGFVNITAYYDEDNITNFEEESIDFIINNGGITVQS